MEWLPNSTKSQTLPKAPKPFQHMIDSFFFFFFYYYLLWLILLLLLLTFQHPSPALPNRPKTIKIRLPVLHNSGHLRQTPSAWNPPSLPNSALNHYPRRKHESYDANSLNLLPHPSLSLPPSVLVFLSLSLSLLLPEAPTPSPPRS